MTDSHPQIDDTLVRRHVLARQVSRLLASHRYETIRLPDYRALLRALRRLPADVRPVLRRLGESLPAAQADLALALLSDLDQTTTPAPVEPPAAQAQVLSVSGEILEEAGEESPPPIELLLETALECAVSPEELALLWLERFMAIPAPDRLPILDRLLASAPGRVRPTLRLEWNWGDLAGDQRLLHLAQSHLSTFPDPWVEFPLVRGVTPPVSLDALQAHVASVDGTGHLTVVLSHTPERDRSTFAVFLMDLWHTGLEDVWGNSGVEATLLDDVLAHFEGLGPEVHLRQVEAEHAAAIVQQAHRLNERHLTLTPPEFWIWSDLCAAPARSAGVRLTPPRRPGA